MNQKIQRKLEGKQFGKLTVLSLAPVEVKQKKAPYPYEGFHKVRVFRWFCKCECGREVAIRESNLIRGTVNSCGCESGFKVTHNKSETVEYSAWKSLIKRCKNEDYEHYIDYGGRGINVCKFIEQSVLNFLSVIGKRPSNEHSVDREDNDKGYTCGTCEECLENGWKLNIKWGTKKEQALNRRPTKIEILGIKIPTYDLSIITKETIENPLFIF